MAPLTRKRKRELEEQDNRPYWWPGRPRVESWVHDQAIYAVQAQAGAKNDMQMNKRCEHFTQDELDPLPYPICKRSKTVSHIIMTSNQPEVKVEIKEEELEEAQPMAPPPVPASEAVMSNLSGSVLIDLDTLPLNDEGKRMCPLCLPKEVTFNTTTQWGRHLMKHRSRWQCTHEECNAPNDQLDDFKTKEDLMRHEKSEHGDYRDGKFHGNEKRVTSATKIWLPSPFSPTKRSAPTDEESYREPASPLASSASASFSNRSDREFHENKRLRETLEKRDKEDEEKDKLLKEKDKQLEKRDEELAQLREQLASFQGPAQSPKEPSAKGKERK